MAFLRGELKASKVIEMKVSKEKGNKLNILLLQKGDNELVLNFPRDINYLFKLEDSESYITEYTINKTKLGYSVDLFFSDKLPP